MLVKFISKVTVAVALASLLGAAAWGQAEKKWKDRAEYDLFDAALKAQDANKKLQLLDGWKEKYPSTDYQEERLLMTTQVYHALNQGSKMYEAARALLKVNPKNFQGLYYITLLGPTMIGDSADRQAAGEKYGKAFLDGLSALQKPANVSEANWAKEQGRMESMGRKTLGWIAMTRKNHSAAEREFREVLKLSPNDGQVSYWLGTVIIAQRDPAKQLEAFFHFARAANYTGEGAMPESGRKQVGDYLRKIYTTYHGDESGMDELAAIALKGAFPPADLKIKSKEQIEFEKEEKLKKENPALALWIGIKEQLTAPDGAQYFSGSMRNTNVSGLRGYLISMSPAQRPTTLVLGLSDRRTREVTLRLDTPFRYPAPHGTALRFEGVPQSFSKEPFMVTFDVLRENVRGWPPPPRRRTTK